MATDPEQSQAKSNGTTQVDAARGILREAIIAVPTVKYALGVAGVACAAFLASVFFGLDLVKASLAILGMLVFMVLLLVVATAASRGHKMFLLPAKLLVWAYTLCGAAAPFALAAWFWLKPPPPPVGRDWIQHGNLAGLPPGKNAVVSVGTCTSTPSDPSGHFTIVSTDACRLANRSRTAVSGFQDFVGPPLPSASTATFDVAWTGTPMRAFEGWVKCHGAGVDADVFMRPCRDARSTSTERVTGHFVLDVPAECTGFTQLEIVPRGAVGQSALVPAVSGSVTNLAEVLPASCAVGSSNRSDVAVTPPSPAPKLDAGATAKCGLAFTPSSELGANVWLVKCTCPPAKTLGRYTVFPPEDGQRLGKVEVARQGWTCNE